MVLLNIYVLFVYLCGVPIVLGYILGWDVAGLFIGVFRNPMIDTLFVIQIVLMYGANFQPDAFVQVYSCSALEDGDEDDDDDQE